jgi:hypothetical protein
MSCPYTSSQNGKAERMIRTTNDTVRTLLLQASLPARFWAESMHTSTYLLNRLPSAACSAPTPHHALFGTPPRYDHLRVFGCACYPNTTATAPHKLAPRSTLCVFLGYSPDHKGYRCYDLTSRRVLTSPLCFPLTRWSSHLCSCFLQVLLHRALRRHRALARRRPVTPPPLLPVRAWPGHLPALPLSFRLTGVPGRRLRLSLRASPSRYLCTSAGPGLRRHLRHRKWPLVRRGHHQWRLPLRRGHRRPRRGLRPPVSRHRCNTRRYFTDTRAMFTLW